MSKYKKNKFTIETLENGWSITVHFSKAKEKIFIYKFSEIEDMVDKIVDLIGMED